MSFKLYSCIAVTVMLAGCGSTPTKFADAPLPFEVPDGWGIESAGSYTVTESGWLNRLNDPQLATLLEAALNANADLNALQAKAKIFELQYGIDKRALYPTAEVGLTSERQEITRGELPGLEESDSANLSLSVDWEVDVWGKLRQEKVASKWSLERELSTLAYAELSLAAQIAQAWYTVTEQQALLELYEQELASWELSKRVLQQRYTGGVDSATAFHQVDAQQYLARVKWQSQKRKVDAAQRRLAVLGGDIPSIREQGEVATVNFPTVPSIDADNIPFGIISNRPDVKAALADLKSYDAKSSAAVRALYPQLKLSVVPALVSAQLSAFDPSANTVTSSVSIAQPIFFHGELEKRAKMAKLEAERSYWEYSQAVLMASESLLNTLTAHDSLEQQLNLQKLALESLKLAASTAEQDYLNGIADVQAWLQVQREYLLQRQEYVSAQSALLRNWIDIQLVTATPIYPVKSQSENQPIAMANLSD